MFLILLAIQACLLLYNGSDPLPTDLWTFVTNIDNWNSLIFIVTLVGIAAGIGLIGVVAGSVFAFKSDFLLLAGAIGGFISMGVVFVNLANTIRDDLISHVFTGCALAGSSCAPVNFILAITVGPVALYYVWTVIDWWRGKDF